MEVYETIFFILTLMGFFAIFAEISIEVKFFLIGLILFILLLILSPVGGPIYKSYQKNLEEMQAEVAKCKTPQLSIVESVNDVNLYEYRADCNSEPIFFSKAGTTWTSTEIRGYGKNQRAITVRNFSISK